jgi:hypothetical protein
MFFGFCTVKKVFGSVVQFSKNYLYVTLYVMPLNDSVRQIFAKNAFKGRAGCLSFYFVTKGNVSCTRMKIMDTLYLLFSDVFHSKFMGDFAS